MCPHFRYLILITFDLNLNRWTTSYNDIRLLKVRLFLKILMHLSCLPHFFSVILSLIVFNCQIKYIESTAGKVSFMCEKVFPKHWSEILYVVSTLT